MGQRDSREICIVKVRRESLLAEFAAEKPVAFKGKNTESGSGDLPIASSGTNRDLSQRKSAGYADPQEAPAGSAALTFSLSVHEPIASTRRPCDRFITVNRFLRKSPPPTKSPISRLETSRNSSSRLPPRTDASVKTRGFIRTFYFICRGESHAIMAIRRDKASDLGSRNRKIRARHGRARVHQPAFLWTYSPDTGM